MITLRLRLLALLGFLAITILLVAILGSGGSPVQASISSNMQGTSVLSEINVHATDRSTDFETEDSHASRFQLEDAMSHEQGGKETQAPEGNAGQDGGCVEWRIMPTIDPDSIAEFYDIEVVASDNAWTVGNYRESSTGNRYVLIEHWDGTQWSVATYPAVIGYLHDIFKLSSNDIWAVGYTTGPRTLAMHWNGSQWTVVPTPNGSNQANYLYAASGVSANDIWAVGSYTQDSGNDHALAMHWDGSAWTIVETPAATPGYAYYLFGVKALASNDVWAVGDLADCCDSRTATMHWDGIQWSVVQSPNIGYENNNLRDVDAVSASEVWAVGGYLMNNYYQTLTMRWNGSEWQVVYSPSPTVSNVLYGIKVVSPTEIWAVGDYSGGSYRRTLALRWNGSDWSLSGTRNASTEDNTLYAASSAAAEQPWAAGFSNAFPEMNTLVERYIQGTCSTPTPTRTPFPTATGTIVTPPPTAIPECGPGWGKANSPNPDIYLNRLYGVEAISETNIWAVGSYANKTLTLHYDGIAWNTIPSPNVGTFTNILRGISALGPNDLWAVGYWSNGPYSWSLILHWDGTQWSIVPSPNVGELTTKLHGVKAISANNVWAVGEYEPTFNTPESLILHWDGTAWTGVAHPAGGILYGIDGTSANDVWAVGTQSYEFPTLTLHWDGTAWTRFTSPDFSTLFDVYAIAPNDVWAVGFAGFNQLAIHWNGTLWEDLSSGWDGKLYGVSGLGTNDIWAAGHDGFQGQIVRRNGTSWTEYLTSSDSQREYLYAIDVISPDNAWAAGYHTSLSTQGKTFIYHYKDRPQFTDAPPGSTFYPFVRCLVCQGVASGYPCGGPGEPCNVDNDSYFRPANNITRGQLSKIVSNSAGFVEPAGAQQFEDILPGSTFYDFIWRLASRGIVSGYECGGPGEPCGGSNLPYFRPNVNITRGQLSKIVSEAAAYNDTPGLQQFEDVLPGSTFYAWIWRLANREIMAGYPCGGPGEPCGGGNLPYFRPGANATRGQASKIVANTFHPACSTLAR